MSAPAPELLDPGGLDASIARDSFRDFVDAFWELVPGAGKLVPNWHIDLFCEELEAIARKVFAGEPRDYDLVLNLPPGTSKSTIWSILFPGWVWTNMPSARVLTASHTDQLALDLSNKARSVIKSEKYQEWFPYITLRDDQDTKGYYGNTLGGDRLTCTVAGKSPMGFHAHFIIVDDPIDPKKVLSEAELKTAREFMTTVIPSRKVDKRVSVTSLIMQRLGIGDPTDVILEGAKKEGAAPVRHICLPSDLDPLPSGGWDGAEVIPRHLAAQYRDGVLDPNRLGREVLGEARARGAHYFGTQFRQKPYSKEGGMFKPGYFLRRVKAAPREAIRIRYWDRAATAKNAPSGPGCATAGTLISKANDCYYIEHCVQGHWEPRERNDNIKATALRDRARYGPNHEPTVLIEMERGSTGLESFQRMAAELAGFPVFEDRPTGDKATRAEPWSAQLAAGNVYVVDDGSWDVQGYVDEHCAFPLGTLLDRVDSSSGAFNRLAAQASPPVLRSIAFSNRDHDRRFPRLVACPKGLLSQLLVEQRSILVLFNDPLFAPGEVMCSGVGDAIPDSVRRQCSPQPSVDGGVAASGELSSSPPDHALVNLADTLTLTFADLDPKDHQETWEAPVPPYRVPAAWLIMDRDHAKKLWGFLLKKRAPSPEVWVFSDGADRRAMSVVKAVADVLRVPRNTIFTAGDLADPDCLAGEGHAPNGYVYDVVKAARGLVIG